VDDGFGFKQQGWRGNPRADMEGLDQLVRFGQVLAVRADLFPNEGILIYERAYTRSYIKMRPIPREILENPNFVLVER
jgi:hypothetical protein